MFPYTATIHKNFILPTLILPIFEKLSDSIYLMKLEILAKSLKKPVNNSFYDFNYSLQLY